MPRLEADIRSLWMSGWSDVPLYVRDIDATVKELYGELEVAPSHQSPTNRFALMRQTPVIHVALAHGGPPARLT